MTSMETNRVRNVGCAWRGGFRDIGDWDVSVVAVLGIVESLP